VIVKSTEIIFTLRANVVNINIVIASMFVFVACSNTGLLMLVIIFESPGRSVQMIITPDAFMAINIFKRGCNRSLKVLIETLTCFEDTIAASRSLSRC
jgi:hypothetical protein